MGRGSDEQKCRRSEWRRPVRPGDLRSLGVVLSAGGRVLGVPAGGGPGPILAGLHGLRRLPGPRRLTARAGRTRHASQRTTIRPWTPGSGKDAASASTASRAARERAPPGLDRHRRARAPPRADDLALDEERARPDARGPERAAAIGVGDQELAIAPLEEEVGVAAREEPCGRRGPGGGAERRLVARRGSTRRRSACAPGSATVPSASNAARPRCRRDARPLGERLRRGGTEDVQVPARELEAGLARVDLGWRHGPDRRLPRAVPPDQDRAGRAPRTGARWGSRRAPRPASP